MLPLESPPCHCASARADHRRVEPPALARSWAHENLRPAGDTPGASPDERGVFLSTLPAGRCERQGALAIVLVSVVALLAVAPFAQVQLTPVWAFIPLYQAAFVMNDGLTALVLFSQFHLVQSRALLVLASGYLFTAGMAVVHGLT